MYKHVSWEDGIEPLLPLFRAEYEKCNIYPEYKSEGEYSEVIRREIKEVKKNAKALAQCENEAALIRPLAIKVICEALQVISVCDKWRKPGEEYRRDALDFVSDWLNEAGYTDASKALDAEFDL